MTNRTAAILSVIVVSSFLFNSCHKDPTPVDLPEEVNLGESVVYSNGEVANYQAFFRFRKVHGIMTYVFGDSIALIANIFGFDFIPLMTGNFNLKSSGSSIDRRAALTSFSQTVSEDLDGYSYKFVDPDEGFFNVESLDTVQQIVKGRFLAKFKRTSKNGNKDLGLPKCMLLQGVFH